MKRHTAIGERNMDEYRKLKELGDEIYNARDMARLQRKLQVAK